MEYTRYMLTPFQIYERLHGLLFGNKPKRRHFNFEIHLTNSCNLNCKSCFHFSPLAGDNDDYPIEQFEKDIVQLSSLFNGKFGWIHILGGEPLLNKRINEYLDIVGRYVKKGKVSLITNGLLIPNMPESFFETCKRNNIQIEISKYPISINYAKIQEITTNHGLKCQIFANYNEKGFSNASLNPDSKLSYKKQYMNCILSNACVTLEKGKLYYCSLPAYVYLYNQNFGETFSNSGDSISIYEHNKKEILDFLRTPHPFCRYCDIKYRDSHIQKWDTSKKEKAEWIKQLP